MANWESLIKDRMRPCIRLAEEDPGKRNQLNQQKKWRKSEQGKAWRKEWEQTPKRKAWKKEYENSETRKQYKKTYREENKELFNERHRAYNATEHGKEQNAKTNKAWREKNKEYDKARKAEWWRRTHPNPKPIGRPKKEKDEGQIN